MDRSLRQNMIDTTKRVLNRFRFVRIKKGFSLINIKHILSVSKTLRKRRYGDDLILEITHPGIGDHLFYSALPELLVTYGLYERVYISSRSVYRVKDTLDIVWGDNPYVSGFVDKKGWSSSGFRPEKGNFLDGLVYQFTGEIPAAGATKPKLYQKSQAEQNEKYYIIDLNRISNKDRLSAKRIASHLDDLLQEADTKFDVIYAYDCELLQEVLTHSVALKKLQADQRLRVRGREDTLRKYFERIQNAEKFLGLYSGGMLIAAAYNTPILIFCEKYDTAVSFADMEHLISSE